MGHFKLALELLSRSTFEPLRSLCWPRVRLPGFSPALLAWITFILVFALETVLVQALPYTPEYEDYNLNQNVSAKSPSHYWGQWSNHSFHPSPKNWRMPFYTLFLDRFVNGDPSNDNANGTLYEHDPTSSILRHGGDITGLTDSLDYLQGKPSSLRKPESPKPYYTNSSRWRFVLY